MPCAASALLQAYQHLHTKESCCALTPVVHDVDPAGTGYMTACLAQLAGPTGHVLALEKQPNSVFGNVFPSHDSQAN
jgi:predicted methyltransferase